jgi:hypothetical protein
MFHEIHSRDLEVTVMDWTWNAWLNPLNTTGDLDLELAMLNIGSAYCLNEVNIW